jgi:hypothetical protein
MQGGLAARAGAQAAVVAAAHPGAAEAAEAAEPRSPARLHALLRPLHGTAPVVGCAHRLWRALSLVHVVSI